MRFLANENFPFPSIKLLRTLGLDIKSIAEETFGIADNEVVAVAQQENRIILTFDSDYGEIIYRHGLDSPPAVIYFRDKGLEPLFAGRMLQRLMEQTDMVFEDAFTVVEADNIRQRQYRKPL
ncbi:DUF5615 family PIN-like protein [Parapedobacter sp. DT-150]|uniref:DUF5615 family PIN-like protein n=1 Tax=Parapedobacter sp. DT-150 TaxID=3396162 RepID=UPI003F1A8371